MHIYFELTSTFMPIIWQTRYRYRFIFFFNKSFSNISKEKKNRFDIQKKKQVPFQWLKIQFYFTHNTLNQCLLTSFEYSNAILVIPIVVWKFRNGVIFSYKSFRSFHSIPFHSLRCVSYGLCIWYYCCWDFS